MWFVHLLFLEILAFTPLFLDPGPFLLPLLFCAWFFLILYFDIPILFFAIIALSFIRDLISAFVIASFISSSLLGSSRTLLSEHFNTCAASLFCILICILSFPLRQQLVLFLLLLFLLAFLSGFASQLFLFFGCFFLYILLFLFLWFLFRSHFLLCIFYVILRIPDVQYIKPKLF